MAARSPFTVGGVYTAMWNNYLNTELLFTATSNFVDLNNDAFQYWDFKHTDPTGAVQVPDGQGNPTLYTAGDLAATMAANPYLLVLSANGYFDSVTPFFQTKLTLDGMPLKDPNARANLAIRNYPSGHMVYLDGDSRTALTARRIFRVKRASTGRAGPLVSNWMALPSLSFDMPHVRARPGPAPCHSLSGATHWALSARSPPSRKPLTPKAPWRGLERIAHAWGWLASAYPIPRLMGRAPVFHLLL